MTLSFGLGEPIKINTIVGLPTFKKWKLVLDVADAKVTSRLLDVYFDICF